MESSPISTASTFFQWLLLPRRGPYEYRSEKWRNWYRSMYLQSNHWRLRKKLLHFWRGYQCQVCHQPGYDLHHLTYKHLFREWFTDLVLLCRSCHDRVHRGEVKVKWSRMSDTAITIISVCGVVWITLLIIGAWSLKETWERKR
jgi:hypothetical protein